MSAPDNFNHLLDLTKWQPWNRTLAEISDDLGVDPSHGLDGPDAHARYAYFGPNVPVDLVERLGFLSVL
ncbi:hypothetical protein EV175_007404, partial [Coemansia sp. RSA 1933]